MRLSLKVFDYIKDFGFVHGCKLYLAKNFSTDLVLKYPYFKYPVYFRNLATKSDIIMFRQIFVSKDYNITVPFNPEIILDLGANVGFASIYFSNRFPAAKIFALEPNADNYKMACKNTQNYVNVKMVQGAIWNSNEKVHGVDKGLGEAAFMIASGNGEGTINAYTIDDVLKDMNVQSADIIKIDIEGSEKEIFEKGFENWMPKTKIIIVETHDRYRRGTSKSVLSAISKYNFSLELSGENLVFYNNELINPYKRL